MAPGDSFEHELPHGKEQEEWRSGGKIERSYLKLIARLCQEEPLTRPVVSLV